MRDRNGQTRDGIPAVVGVHDATTRLSTGERVRVDGTNGRITILDA